MKQTCLLLWRNIYYKDKQNVFLMTILKWRIEVVSDMFYRKQIYRSILCYWELEHVFKTIVSRTKQSYASLWFYDSIPNLYYI